MPYSSLANETINQIVNLIPSSDVENFALIDTRTYHIAATRLEEQRALKRNAKVMTARFGAPYRFIGICMSSQWNMLDRRPELKYSRPSDGALADLDYLGLNGDLYWLQPYEEMTENAHPWDRGSGISKERLDALIASGRRVGIGFQS